jgi:UDP-N-acetylmuramoyl-L-alanyl-D-glutamate--2,6-diaminopimelate ligase
MTGIRPDAALLRRIGAPAGAVLPVHVAGVTSDSRKVRPGWVFVAVPGTRTDGHDYIEAAIAAGAAAVVAQRPVPGATVPVVIVDDARAALAHLAWATRGDPTARFRLVGITGTDGKSSTAMLIESGFRGCGLVTGLIGTVEYRVAGRSVVAAMTTPDPETLADLFADMAAAGVGGAAMEVSSHALDQRRVEGCRFDCAILTNLTRDHLDYHGTVEAYALAKLRLFAEVLPASPDARGAVANRDDALFDRIVAACPLPVFGFSMDPASDAAIAPIDAAFDLDGLRATLRTPWGRFAVASRLIGRHNLQNIMAAVGAAGVMGLPLPAFVAGVCALDRIPGRLEAVRGRKNVRVLVDYAHTPQAVHGTLSVLRGLGGDTPLTAIIGAGGDRDPGKRPLMGRAAALLADRVIITSDNPRSENPRAIVDQIVGGVEQARAEGLVRARIDVEVDRREAIRRAIAEAQPGETVAICGKGHESFQDFGTHRIHFSDVETAKEYLDA